MRTKVHFLKFDEVLSTLRTLGFDVQTSPGVANQIAVRKYGAGATLVQAPKGNEKVPQSSVTWVHKPGFVVGGEVAFLLDKGNQKFWKSSNNESATWPRTSAICSSAMIPRRCSTARMPPALP